MNFRAAGGSRWSALGSTVPVPGKTGPGELSSHCRGGSARASGAESPLCRDDGSRGNAAQPMAQEQPPGDAGGGYARGEQGIGVHRWQPGQSARRSRLAGGQYTNFSVRQYRQSTPRMRPGGRTGRPAAVITAAPGAGLVAEPVRAGLVAGPVIGLAAFDAETASGEGAHGPGRSRPATCGQDRMNPRGKPIRGAPSRIAWHAGPLATLTAKAGVTRGKWTAQVYPSA